MTSALLTELQAQVGQTFQSEWLLIDQAMIDRFAEATGDFQYIHVDPERAAQTPFGGTVAHGFLTLSLLSRLNTTLHRPPIKGIRIGINYGLDRVRFVHPVRSGSRVRAVTTIVAIEEKRPGQFRQTLNVTVEIEGVEKPALTAVWINQFQV
jgi:acyl dehydratase